MTTTSMTTSEVLAEPLPADWRDLLALTKPKVMRLVVYTGAAGLLAAPTPANWGPVNILLGFTAVL